MAGDSVSTGTSQFQSAASARAAVGVTDVDAAVKAPLGSVTTVAVRSTGSTLSALALIVMSTLTAPGSNFAVGMPVRVWVSRKPISGPLAARSSGRPTVPTWRGSPASLRRSAVSGAVPPTIRSLGLASVNTMCVASVTHTSIGVSPT